MFAIFNFVESEIMYNNAIIHFLLFQLPFRVTSWRDLLGTKDLIKNTRCFICLVLLIIMTHQSSDMPDVLLLRAQQCVLDSRLIGCNFVSAISHNNRHTLVFNSIGSLSHLLRMKIKHSLTAHNLVCVFSAIVCKH